MQSKYNIIRNGVELNIKGDFSYCLRFLSSTYGFVNAKEAFENGIILRRVKDEQGS